MRGLLLPCWRRRIHWLPSWLFGGAKGTDGSRNEFVRPLGECTYRAVWASMPGFFLLCREWSRRSRHPGREDGAADLRVASQLHSIPPALAGPTGKECPMARKLFLLLVPLLLGLMAGPALAQATSATIQITYNGVIHESTGADGSQHVTGTNTGTVVLTPEDPSLPSYTGRFTEWFGGNFNSSETVGFWETFSVRLIGSDGSRLTLNEVEQLHISATGEVTVDFQTVNCR